MSSLTIGFLGAGKMATALARGFLKAGLTTPAQMLASDPFPGARDVFATETGARTVPSNLAVIEAAKIVLIAVKPDQVAALLQEISGKLRPDHLLLSIAAGISLARLESGVPPGTRVVRVMPNTPALVGESASAYAAGQAATAEDAALVQKLFGSVGLAIPVPEKLLNAVTGLSGSGPAYGFLMIEALADGGVAAGLPRETAQRLAAQTLRGAAQMVLETGLHPGVLKDAVASPGGTTIDGIHELEKGGVRAALMNAVRAAAEKSARLG